MKQTYQCPNCGAPVAFGVRFCGNCGTQFNWPAQQQPPPPSYQEKQQWGYGHGQVKVEKQKTSSWIVVFIALAVVAVLVGGGIFALNTISEKTPPPSSPPVTPPSSTPPTDGLPAPDVKAPTITNVKVTSVTETSAVITWTTDEPATSEIEYGQTAGHPALPVTKADLVVSHSITLSDLFPDTEYKYRVKSRDGSGNEAISDYYTFTTVERYKYHDYYPIILSFSDDKGNVIKSSSHNGYTGSHGSSITGTDLRIGDEIQWEVTAVDPEGRQIWYNFHSNSDRFNQLVGHEVGGYKWTTNNRLTYQIGEEDIRTAGENLRIVACIKTEKEYLRNPGATYDDATFLDYKLLP